MSFSIEVVEGDFGVQAATTIASVLPSTGSMVLTGGTTAGSIYEALVSKAIDLSSLDIFFSDERAVPPDDEASNYGMARRLLLDPAGATRVHRMRGEDPPAEAARAYHEEVAPAVASGFELLLLGMGADCHIAAMFPRSSALAEGHRLCLSVDRPDGLTGLTLTPPALAGAAKVLLLVSGAAKAQAVRRAVAGDESPEACPARLLADHPDATFVLDEAAASELRAR